MRFEFRAFYLVSLGKGVSSKRERLDTGRTELGEVDVVDGPARGLTPAEVQSVSAALAVISGEELWSQSTRRSWPPSLNLILKVGHQTRRSTWSGHDEKKPSALSLSRQLVLVT